MGTRIPLAHSIPEAAGRLGIGRTLMYELIDAGEIPTVKIGRRRLVTEAALVEYLERLQRTEQVAPVSLAAVASEIGKPFTEDLQRGGA